MEWVSTRIGGGSIVGVPLVFTADSKYGAGGGSQAYFSKLTLRMLCVVSPLGISSVLLAR